MASICCPAENPIENEARLATAQIKASPVHVWWHRRRRLNSPPTRVANGDSQVNHSTDRSPFPKSWSINYSGKSAEGISDHVNGLLGHFDPESCVSEESSVFSTASQEQLHKLKHQIDASGNCIHHPQIQLARKKQQPSKSRFPKIFSKHHGNNADTNNNREEEWDIINMPCPECEKDHIKRSKDRYHYKPSKPTDTSHQELDDDMTAIAHIPFPATLTIVESHPHLEVKTMALRVRTDPIPTEQTLHLSCVADNDDKESTWEWETPDGAWDFVIQADKNGEIKQVSEDVELTKKDKGIPRVRATANQVKSSEYQIMERIIPLSSIDHVSRGGDAWDVLRQSTGENDFGCSCDVKIHGFSDRLLRFDLVTFDGIKGGSINKHNYDRLRYSFAGVDFSKSFEAIYGNSSFGADSNKSGQEGSYSSDDYTTENVISKLNLIVSYDREARKSGVGSMMTNISNMIDECLGLGVHEVEGEELSVKNVKDVKPQRRVQGMIGLENLT